MVRTMLKHHDPWSVVVIILTLVLFIVALFIKGLTHDILLEAGVFLVSVKLILLARRQSEVAESVQEKLDRIQQTLDGNRQQKRMNDSVAS
jgi:predicted tellurium resistance membrane protein TerC